MRPIDTPGFREAFARYGIRTVVNLQDEDPDPQLAAGFYREKPTTPESEVCEQAGVRYVMISFDMPRRDKAPFEQAKSIDEFLKLLDDPKAYPILLHCKAGLHRTGLLTAVYRMEYEALAGGGSSPRAARNGFGDTAATTANDYIYSYLENYQPRWKRQAATPRSKETADGLSRSSEGPP